MKWLSRIRRRGEDIPATVAFDEIDVWLERVTNSLFGGFSADSYDGLVSKREELRDCVNRLRDASPKEDLPAQIMKIGLLSRDKMVKLLYSLCDRLSVPAQVNYRTVWEFHNMASSTIDSILSKVSKNAYFVRSVFPDELKDVETSINQLIAALNRLITPLKAKEQELADLTRIYALIARIKSQREDIDTENEKIRAEEAEYEAIKRDLERSKEQLRAMEQKQEWKRLLACQSELTALKSELTVLESEIRDMFAPMQKPLNLLKKQDETGRIELAPYVRAAVNSILASPVRVLNEDISEYLRAIREVISENKGVLKTTKRESALKWIDQLLSNDLRGLSARYESLRAREEALSRELAGCSSLKAERDEIEHAIATAGMQLERLEESISKRKQAIESRQEELTLKEKLLQKELENITGKPIEVVY